MPSTAIRSHTRVWLIFAAVALALVGSAIEETKAQSDEAVTVEDCKDAWNSAPARPNCSNVSGDISLSGGQCRIRKSCTYDPTGGLIPNSSQFAFNDVTVPLADVDDLRVCGGQLQVGPC